MSYNFSFHPLFSLFWNTLDFNCGKSLIKNNVKNPQIEVTMNVNKLSRFFS